MRRAPWVGAHCTVHTAQHACDQRLDRCEAPIPRDSRAKHQTGITYIEHACVSPPVRRRLGLGSAGLELGWSCGVRAEGVMW